MEIKELQDKLVELDASLEMVNIELDVLYESIAEVKKEQEQLQDAKSRILAAMAQLKGIDTEYSVRSGTAAQRNQPSP